MKLAVIAFTANGLDLEQRLGKFLIRQHQTELFLKSKYVSVPGDSMVHQVSDSLGAWAEKQIPGRDGVIFIGAAGIAVRTIAPFVRDKKTDPAVVVLDEKGQFVISLLSGHLGGANKLALQIAEEIGAVPVITTATDVNHHFAVDVFAGKNHLWISDMKLAKEVSAQVLQEKRLPAGAGSGYAGRGAGQVFSELEFSEKDSPDGRKGTFWIEVEKDKILHLVPAAVTLGIGCRKGTACSEIEAMVTKTLGEQGIFLQSVVRAASIDLKKEEPGLLEFCEKWKLPLVTYTAGELQQAEGEFSSSSFVSRITGVDNVCERSAVLGSGQGTLLVKKRAQNGVTIACATEEWSVDFE